MSTRAETPTRDNNATAAPTMTAAQKQKLIDNLQVEATHRARALRAQYAEMADHLCTKIEGRIIRIPAKLRSANIGELVDKFSESLQEAPKTRPLPTIPSTLSRANITATTTSSRTVQPAQSRGVKRSSDEMIGSDKENQAEDIAMPKKRGRPAAAVPKSAAAQKAAPRKVDPSQVLSPKSNNSRTLPAPPNSKSPAKSGLMGPPEKPARVTKAAGSVRGRPARQAAPAKTTRVASNASSSSAGTVVTKKAPAAKPAAKKGGIMSKVTGMATAAGRRAAAAKKEAAAPAATGRVLRTRK
ncbi:hypothetical protein BT63DRAFT_419913 [Microthyrium microscopicum]|uniref:Borealin N-terminal domain-containing protein n=1 Tax=Microthyrium microscopicum TaxID=703497 RepID=A0A6A6US96_9PEZI|nr:hypothetical protein BT63DRAFT_419913 [Microthyrium microscopicum]